MLLLTILKHVFQNHLLKNYKFMENNILLHRGIHDV